MFPRYQQTAARSHMGCLLVGRDVANYPLFPPALPSFLSPPLLTRANGGLLWQRQKNPLFHEHSTGLGKIIYLVDRLSMQKYCTLPVLDMFINFIWYFGNWFLVKIAAYSSVLSLTSRVVLTLGGFSIRKLSLSIRVCLWTWNTFTPWENTWNSFRALCDVPFY